MVKAASIKSMLVDRYGKQLSYTSTATYSSNSRKLTSSRYVQQTGYGVGNSTTNPYKFLNPSERRLINQFALDLFHSSPIIHSAIQRKNEWASATAWKPLYRGVNKAWGILATEYLNTIAYPNIYAGGGNMTFNRLLLTIGNQLDILGDVLFVLTLNQGIPQVELYPSSMIGCREYGKTTVESGTYTGATIDDGVITNKRGKAIAYRLLGDTKADDYDASGRSAFLLFEQSELGVRGTSVLAPGLLTALTSQQVADALTQMAHTEAKRQLIVSTATGNGDEYASSGNDMGDDINGTTTANTHDREFTPDTIDLGDVTFINAKSGEKVESLKTDRPHANAQEWIRFLTEQYVYDCGWALPLISPEKLNQANLKCLESQVQQTIDIRQQTLKRFVNIYSLYALSVAMDSGELPLLNDSEWRKWDWSKPDRFVINDDTQIRIQGWTAGVETLDDITNGNGNVIRNQRTDEMKQAIDKANELVEHSKGKLSFERALNLVGVGGTPQVNPVAEQSIKTETK